MASFEQVLKQSTARGANIVPGCVLAAVDKNGEILYSKAAGFNGVAPDAEPISLQATFWIASCTKLLGTIATLQCVERGQVALDEPVGRILPELAELEILHFRDDSDGPQLTTTKTTSQITLRQLLCHTSGVAYDMFPASLIAWRASRQESIKCMEGSIADAHTLPLLFEPGEGWGYGGGIDWAGLIVMRLNNVTLEEYFQEHIYSPLGMTSTTFRFENHPDIQKRLVKTAERMGDGTFREASKHWPDFAAEDCAGTGLYSTVEEYMRVLGDLIKDNPILLKRETIEREMFTAQLPRDSASHAGLLASSHILKVMIGSPDGPKGINWGLGGMLFEEDVGPFKAGTLFWGGYSNLTWFTNRREGIAGFYASQVLPTGDPATINLVHSWINELWRNRSSR